ncbi:hypothetical protein WMY93_018722 [Mugilogobius chulae]|uniref:Hexosyltransferase n=1 Tax=Mugilogobius chulae TaxID=88201 RepID=A0AAW0NKT3_9GOBI
MAPVGLEDEALPFYDVLVGVLSARHHHELRQAIRETWLGYIQRHPHFQHRVGVKFIVGKQGCPIPEEDREDPYSCTLLNFTESVLLSVCRPRFPVGAVLSASAERDVQQQKRRQEWVLEMLAVMRREKTIAAVKLSGYLPLDSVVGQSSEIEIVKLPDSSVLFSSDVSVIALDFKTNVTVKLLQLDQEEAVVTARFSSISTGALVNGVWYKPVEQFILPKGFEGTLVWESLDSAGLTSVNSSVQLNDGGGVLKFSSIAEGILPHRSALGFPGLAGGFTFNIYDGEALSTLLRARPSRMEQHVLELQQEDESLERESRRHRDMVFVDVVDTYRNVPTKLLQFYKWSVRNADFNLLLKTDDDCFIDVDAVLNKIDQKALKRSNFWWGNFRQSWAVDRIGKWQELEYPSPAYPAFACGSGYVVSRDLVQWLASNAEKLKLTRYESNRTAGEDVSMGIWMAAVGPQKYQDAGWLCEKECYLDMLSSPQHSVQELHQLWDRKQACGDPCGCPWGH